MLLWLLVILAAPPKPAPTGPLPSALYKSVSEALGVLEVEVPLGPEARSTQRWVTGVSKAKVVGMVAQRAPMDPPTSVTLQAWEVLRSCLALTKGRASVKALLVLTGADGYPSPLPFAVFGLGLESTPGYEALKAAVVESFTWREERMRAVPVEQLWSTQRSALLSDNAYLRHLAAEFLIQHDAAAVIDAVWGAPGTPERERFESGSKVAPRCHD